MRILGMVGLGRMGAPIAQRLMGAGYEFVACDSDPEVLQNFAARGAHTAATAREVADRADVVITCLPMPDIVRSAAIGRDGAVHGSRAKYLIDISTTGTEVARQIDAAFTAKGKVFVDAPVTGGVAGAKNGVLTMITAAPPEAVEAMRPIIETIGNKLVFAGSRPGDGQMLKTINNLLSFVALEVTSEAMALGVRYGLDADAMLATFNSGTGRNSATEEKFPRSVMPRTFDFGFSVASANKDIRLCLTEAENLGVPMPVSTAAKQIWTAAMAEMPNDDMTSIVKLFERWASVEVRGQAAK